MRKKSTITSVTDVIDTGLEVIKNELNKLKVESELTDVPLNAEEAGRLVKYLNAALAVNKDARESTLKGEVAKMSDEELEELAKDYLK